MEQNRVIDEMSVTGESSPQNYQTTHTSVTSTNENFGKKLIITILGILPTRLLTDPILLASSNMDTITWISKKFGFKIYKCRYCHHYFSSASFNCGYSPTKKHRE